jgi:hypothetical protein
LDWHKEMQAVSARKRPGRALRFPDCHPRIEFALINNPASAIPHPLVVQYSEEDFGHRKRPVGMRHFDGEVHTAEILSRPAQKDET